MKDLSDMKISEFIDAILAHTNEYSQLEVYDYLDDKTKGFSLARVDAILELLISKYPTNNLTPEERDWRFKLLTLEEWHNLSLRPDPSKYQIKVNEIENWVTIRPIGEKLFWYVYDILNEAYNEDMNVKLSRTTAQHEYPSYIMQAFDNNTLLIDKFFERIASMPGERKTTPIAIEIEALQSLGMLNTGQLTLFTKELNKVLASRGITAIGYRGLAAAVGTQKNKMRFKAVQTEYKIFLESKSE